MPDVFRAASLVVLPSYAEGMPLALPEAQACGRACITTDAPGCREAIAPNETGLLVFVRYTADLARAIDTLLSDAGRLLRMGRAARSHAELHFGVEAVVAQTLDAFVLAGASL